VTVSLATLTPERSTALTRADTRHRVREGIEAVAGLGFGSLKLNVVVMRGFNDDELVPLVEYGKRVGAEVRFIEYMDVGGATRWSPNRVVSQAGDASRAGAVLPLLRPEPAHRRWPLVPLPLRAAGERPPGAGRSGASTEEIRSLIVSRWRARGDRGAEARLELERRSPLVPLDSLRARAPSSSWRPRRGTTGESRSCSAGRRRDWRPFTKCSSRARTKAPSRRLLG